ncbi:helix-turn-helix domain-containing protein [Streptomyces sp. NPDC096310]|uniref:helix-turn-helix domain-containing protein n=1 Tax=Streptomyces sp. NPDC096310 TaxID=3366082 RepID=UPI0037F58977
MAKEIDTSLSVAGLFGGRVRRLRARKGLTQREPGRLVSVEHSRIAQVELATGSKPTIHLARALDTTLDADGLLEEMWPHVRRERYPNWSHGFMVAEKCAVRISVYMSHTVPGLLQTEDYAHAVLRKGRNLKSKEQLQERVAARLDRQALLNGPEAPEIHLIIDESVLRRPMGGVAVMRNQLARLLDVTDNPRFTFHVLAFSSGEHAHLGGSLTLLTMPDGTEFAYTESVDDGQLFQDPDEVGSYGRVYQQLRTQALPPGMSIGMSRSAMVDDYLGSRVPTRSQRRRLTQVQLQQPRSWGRGPGFRSGSSRSDQPRT